jgi:hypothetical protein
VHVVAHGGGTLGHRTLVPDAHAARIAEVADWPNEDVAAFARLLARFADTVTDAGPWATR